MPRVTLEFQLPEEQGEYKSAVNGQAAHSALWTIAQEVFRPARKHGYTDPELRRMIESLEGGGEDLVAALEKKFYEILEEYKITLED